MRLTHIDVNLRRIGGGETYTATFLVDTGAVHSMASASELTRIGIQPVGNRTYETASGERVEYEYGVVEMEFLNEIVHSPVIFGPDDTEPLLGVIALESAGFIVDPKSQMLKKLAALPLKQAVFGEITVTG